MLKIAADRQIAEMTSLIARTLGADKANAVSNKRKLEMYEVMSERGLPEKTIRDMVTGEELQQKTEPRTATENDLVDQLVSIPVMEQEDGKPDPSEEIEAAPKAPEIKSQPEAVSYYTGSSGCNIVSVIANIKPMDINASSKIANDNAATEKLVYDYARSRNDKLRVEVKHVGMQPVTKMQPQNWRNN